MSKQTNTMYVRLTEQQDYEVRLIQARVKKTIQELGLPGSKPALTDVLTDLVQRGLDQYKKDTNRL